MRACAKVRCEQQAAATVLLRYAAREVEVVPLVPDPDPNLVDLCAEHADRLTPPIGWSLRDSRAGLPASA